MVLVSCYLHQMDDQLREFNDKIFKTSRFVAIRVQNPFAAVACLYFLQQMAAKDSLRPWTSYLPICFMTLKILKEAVKQKKKTTFW